MNKPRVLLTLPNEGWHHAANSAVTTLIERDARFAITTMRSVARPYENNMNKLALFAKKFDYWLNIDADNAPRRNPLDLVELDKDVIGCPYLGFKSGHKFPFFWSAFDREGDAYIEHKFQEDLEEVDAISSGCMLIATRVLHSVKQPFLRRFDDDGIVTLGCDLSFCQKAKDAGYRIWSHFGYKCSHYKEIDLLEVIRVISEVNSG